MSFATRSEGLTRRHAAQSTMTVEDEQEEVERREEEEDMDSKETRLTLMEEVLLLGLKDREVCLVPDFLS